LWELDKNEATHKQPKNASAGMHVQRFKASYIYLRPCSLYL
jgi:hypothetical protein